MLKSTIKVNTSGNIGTEELLGTGNILGSGKIGRAYRVTQEPGNIGTGEYSTGPFLRLNVQFHVRVSALSINQYIVMKSVKSNIRDNILRTTFIR